MKQTVRIIGGKFRGKKLPFPAVEGLRPTPDRVRETLFNWLMNDIRDARCLDAFAGSGAIGFEAFSRGASKVTMLEKNTSAYHHLVKLAAPFSSPCLSILQIDALDYLQKTKEQFDVVFLDPPFSETFIPPCLNLLANTDLISSGGLVYLESPKEIEVNNTQWQKLKLKQAGQIFYGLYQKN